ncbi:MAG TPA: GlsB/YeaQ/YmgE family stress response membrane protein [Ignavibacteriaceae bacterium]|jgi:uncharacterized membrane protein YeaQ/YmgE (transglycosylase-associated protein family)|nr:MAG: Transglycosylase associated protein [Ignavibacteria bacterium ADurb.Bin266]OQY73555.1 MAG: hypothetical protein B6D44_06905 [Ignavibacteriales bacterium UTCHB2]HQF41552.1 GlsB/YeaQ/YmgE family stress response membrane protein [Ignavibacteriaceae bacterium]HQI39996.1 GlsB/YeaQ/YmgE family stress response membrane protein [Ignavibacteriaceae bacterium]HQJ46201.1 GlsB/YeaQ/YmgE family stress response membrane protein [Ignavibacteriaceae bacterium]
MFEIILLLVIASITGGIGRSLTGFKKGGCIISIVVGFIGAYIGTILARQFNFPDLWTVNIRGIDYPIIWSIIGAVVFTAILSLIVPKKN